MSDNIDTKVEVNGDTENTVTVKNTQTQQDKTIIIDTNKEENDNSTSIDYKKEYSDLLLVTALKESKSLQALDLPQEIALEYFKKYFTVEEDKGKLSIVGRFQDSKLVNKEGTPVSVDEVIKHVVANNKELGKQAIKKASSYKGSIGAAPVNLKSMTVAEKLAYRKQVGPSVYRSILEKQ